MPCRTSSLWSRVPISTSPFSSSTTGRPPARKVDRVLPESLPVAGGVIERIPPGKRVERARFDADTAIHAQAVVDGEFIQDIDRARTPSSFLAHLFHVRFDRDAPRWALAHAHHARRARLRQQGDHVPLRS